MQKRLVNIPQVEKLLQEEGIKSWFERISRPIVTSLIQEVLESLRQQEEAPLTKEHIISLIEKRCRSYYRKGAIGVVNCTGIIIHTNLGRSILSEDLLKRAAFLNSGYCSLEFNLESGKRGNRNSFSSELLSCATGSESSLVVNNNAAALFLLLNTFAKRKEVIVSRGELVQIGGGFRIPDIMRQSGAKLVEVGTTNVTTVADYIEAITEKTAMVLLVHKSNFAQRGFTSTPTTKEIAKALPDNLLLAIDQGSGLLSGHLPSETSVQQHLKGGADLVTFSGDKLLGSVQAGCVVGKGELIDKMIKSPLYRILRPGKTTLSLLQESLVEHLNLIDSPIMKLAKRGIKEMRTIAEHLIADLNPSSIRIVDSSISLGGGSSADEYMPSLALEIRLPERAQETLRQFREYETPVIGVIQKGRVLLNVGSLLEKDIATLREALLSIVGR